MEILQSDLQIHAKIHVGPVQPLPDVLLLLQGEHVLVEELLELLVDVVNANLLEAVVVEDLEAGNVEHTNVGDLLHRGVNPEGHQVIKSFDERKDSDLQGLVALVDDDPECALVDSASDAGHRVGSVLAGGAFVHPLGADLQLGFAEVVDHPFSVDAKQGGHLDAVGLVPELN